MSTFALWWFKWGGGQIKAQEDVLGGKFYHRAYYFSTDLRVIDEMEDYCQNNLGEPYV